MSFMWRDLVAFFTRRHFAVVVKTTRAFIAVPQCPHKKCNKYSSLHGNAHEWEMWSVKKVKERCFVAREGE